MNYGGIIRVFFAGQFFLPRKQKTPKKGRFDFQISEASSQWLFPTGTAKNPKQVMGLEDFRLSFLGLFQ